MELIFYKRRLGKDETVFYQRVKEEFFKTAPGLSELSGEALLDAIVSEIRKISSGKKVKEIFANLYKCHQSAPACEKNP